MKDTERDGEVPRQVHQDGSSAGRSTDRPKVGGIEQLAMAALPSLLVVLALLAASTSPDLAPTGLFDRPFELLGLILLGAVAAVHRPLADAPRSNGDLVPGDSTGDVPGNVTGDAARAMTLSLGLGAAVLPVLHQRQGAVVAAVGAFCVLSAAELVRAYATSRFERLDDGARSWVHVLERAVLFAWATLLAAGFADALAGGWGGEGASLAPGWIALASALVYIGAFAGTVWAVARIRQRPFVLRLALPPLALDAVGWLFGFLGADLAAEVGWSRLAVLWIALALLSAEAARNALLRGRSDQRLGSFERLQEAHERILSETSGMGEIAQQVSIECRNVLPVEWFQFELPEADGYWQSWASGPDGLVVEGRPKPPARPDMLPGIHRRASWKVLERSLVRTVDGQQETLARLRTWCDPRRVEAGAEALLDTLIPQMASSVHRARLDREARLDPLTGVPVRRVLDSRLQRAYRQSCEQGTPMAVIMCDIDFFKRVNDDHGHAAGDEALQLVAATLDAERREKDLCCRYGGEEFTILLEETDGDAALRLAERLRRAVEALRFSFDGRAIPLTLSLGVAAFPELHIKTASELLLLADEALYEAKERGRNQCLLNIGREAYRAPGAVGPREPTTPARPPLL